MPQLRQPPAAVAEGLSSAALNANHSSLLEIGDGSVRRCAACIVCHCT
jgi:hypothetical protein